MIKLLFLLVFMLFIPLVGADQIFEGENVPSVFNSQDFESNSMKAKGGDVRAQYLVGAAYLFGLEEQGVEVDYEKGLCWMEAAAKQGAAEAYYELAVVYRRGLGVDKDGSKWEEYMEEAAERGMRSAQQDLRDIYRDGDSELGIARDDEKYYYWLEVTANDGNVLSMMNMANRYRQGRGVSVDLEKSFDWIMKAVDLDDPFAQGRAGEYFENGLGTEQDLVKAYMMYDLAGGVGSEERKDVAEKMTEEQVQEAIARSWQWQLERNSYRPSSNGYRYQPNVGGREPLSLTSD